MDSAEKIRLLQEKAALFLKELERISENDDEVEDFLRTIKPLFEKIERGLITPPVPYEYRFWDGKDREVRDKYPALSEAEATFTAVLEDAISAPWFRQMHVEAGEPIWWETKQ